MFSQRSAKQRRRAKNRKRTTRQPAIERMGQRVRQSQRLQFTHPRSAATQSAALESSATEAVVPFLREGSLMKVNVRINEDLVEPFYVDTGASSVVIPERVARALELDIGSSAQRELAMTPGGIVEMKVVQLASLDLNGARVNNLRTLVSNQLEIGLLGGAFLRHFNYSVDSDGGMIVLEPASRGETRH